MDRMNLLLTGHPAYPIEIHVSEDPEWQIWSESVSALDVRSDD
jgi:hypothetical protein